MLEARQSCMGCVQAGGPSSAAYHSLLGVYSLNVRRKQGPVSVTQMVFLEVCICPHVDSNLSTQAVAVHSERDCVPHLPISPDPEPASSSTPASPTWCSNHHPSPVPTLLCLLPRFLVYTRPLYFFSFSCALPSTRPYLAMWLFMAL